MYASSCGPKVLDNGGTVKTISLPDTSQTGETDFPSGFPVISEAMPLAQWCTAAEFSSLVGIPKYRGVPSSGSKNRQVVEKILHEETENIWDFLFIDLLCADDPAVMRNLVADVVSRQVLGIRQAVPPQYIAGESHRELLPYL